VNTKIQYQFTKIKRSKKNEPHFFPDESVISNEGNYALLAESFWDTTFETYTWAKTILTDDKNNIKLIRPLRKRQVSSLLTFSHESNYFALQNNDTAYFFKLSDYAPPSLVFKENGITAYYFAKGNTIYGSKENGAIQSIDLVSKDRKTIIS